MKMYYGIPETIMSRGHGHGSTIELTLFFNSKI